MKRLTEKRFGKNVIPLRQNGKIKWSICSAGMGDAPAEYLYGDHADRLAAIEDILGEEYDLDRLGKLVEGADLLGKTVYEPNKRGFISTYEIISVHISTCSVLVGWNLLDGIYSSLNGFEISALGKTVFLTRAEAQAALRREQE